MTLPGGVSVLALVAVFIIGAGVVLHIIGLATPNWSTIRVGEAYEYYGIWKGCGFKIEETCFEFNSQPNLPEELSNSIKVCEAFGILGMLASVLGLAMAAIFVLLPIMGKPKNSMFPVISLAGCVASFIFILITVIVWGAKVHSGYWINFVISYSFFLSIIGGILIGIGGVLVRVSNRSVS